MVTPYSSSSSSSTSTSRAQIPNPLKRPAEFPIQTVSNKVFKGLPQKQTDSSPPIKVSPPLKTYQTRPNLRLHPEPELWFQPPDFETLCRLLFSELDVPLEKLYSLPKTAVDSHAEAELLKAINQLKMRIEKNLSRVSYKDAIYLLHMCDQAKVSPPESCLELIASRLSIEDKSQLVRFGFLLPNFFREALKDLLFQDLSHELDPRAKPKFTHWAGYHEILNHIIATCNSLIEKSDELRREDSLTDLIVMTDYELDIFKKTPFETRKRAVEGLRTFCEELLQKLHDGKEIHLPFFYHGTKSSSEKIIPKGILEQEIMSRPELRARYLGAFVSTRIEDSYGPPGIALPFHTIYRPADEVLNFFMPSGQKLQAWISFRDGIPLRAHDLEGNLVKHEISFIYNLHSCQEDQLTGLFELNYREIPPMLNITEAKLFAGLISHYPLLLPIHLTVMITENPNSIAPNTQTPINPNSSFATPNGPIGASPSGPASIPFRQLPTVQIQLGRGSVQLSQRQHAALPAMAQAAGTSQPFSLASVPPNHLHLPRAIPQQNTLYSANAPELPRELTSPNVAYGVYLKAFNTYLQDFFLYDLKTRGLDIVIKDRTFTITKQPDAPALDIAEQFFLRHILFSKNANKANQETINLINSLTKDSKSKLNSGNSISLFIGISLLREKCTKSISIHPELINQNIIMVYYLFTKELENFIHKQLTLGELESFFRIDFKNLIGTYLSSENSCLRVVEKDLAPCLLGANHTKTQSLGLEYKEIFLKGYKLPPIKCLKKNDFYAFLTGNSTCLLGKYFFLTRDCLESNPSSNDPQPFWIKDLQPSFSLDRFFRICKEKPKFARQAIMEGLLTVGAPINAQNFFTPVIDRRRDLITAAKEALPSLNIHFQERHIWSDLSSDYGKAVGYHPELIFNSSSVTALLYEMMSAVRFYLSCRKDLAHSFNGTFQERIFNLLVYYILNASKPLSADELLCSIDNDSTKLEVKIDYNTFDEGDVKGRDWRQYPNEPGIAHALLSQLRQEYQIPDSIIMEYLLGAEAPKEHEKPLELFKQFVFEIGQAIHARYFCKFIWGEAQLLPPRPGNEPLIRLLAGDDAEKIEELESYKTFVILNK